MLFDKSGSTRLINGPLYDCTYAKENLEIYYAYADANENKFPSSSTTGVDSVCILCGRAQIRVLAGVNLL